MLKVPAPVADNDRRWIYRGETTPVRMPRHPGRRLVPVRDARIKRLEWFAKHVLPRLARGGEGVGKERCAFDAIVIITGSAYGDMFM